MLALGAALLAQAAQAQYNDDDLVVGFTGGSNGTNLVVDIGANPGQTTDLSSSVGSYATVFGSLGANGVNMGVIGGNNGNSSTADVWTTTLRTGRNVTDYQTAGTESAPHTPINANIDNGSQLVYNLTFGAVANGNIGSFSYNIAQNPTTAGAVQNSFASYLGSNPLSAVTAGGYTTLDLWTISDNGGGPNSWTYAGDLVLNLTGASPSLTFDPTPEPSTCTLLGGAGALVLFFRRKFSLKKA